MAQPRIGDSVLFRELDDGRDLPAIVTRVDDNPTVVDLVVFDPAEESGTRVEFTVDEDTVRDADVPARTWRPRVD